MVALQAWAARNTGTISKLTPNAHTYMPTGLTNTTERKPTYKENACTVQGYLFMHIWKSKEMADIQSIYHRKTYFNSKLIPDTEGSS
jgi:hypothetical protein